jgi:hypothetical protein
MRPSIARLKGRLGAEIESAALKASTLSASIALVFAG